MTVTVVIAYSVIVMVRLIWICVLFLVTVTVFGCDVRVDVVIAGVEAVDEAVREIRVRMAMILDLSIANAYDVTAERFE